MVGPPSNKTTLQDDTEKWLSGQSSQLTVDLRRKDQRPTSSSSSLSAVSSTKAVIGANENEVFVPEFLPPQEPTPAPATRSIEDIAKALGLVSDISHVQEASERESEGAFDRNLRMETSLHTERELHERFTGLGVAESRLKSHWDKDNHNKATGIEELSLDMRGADKYLSKVEASADHSPRDAAVSHFPNAHVTTTRAQITPVELVIKVNNLLMAFRDNPDLYSACYTLEFSRAIVIIGHEHFVRMDGVTRSILRPGSFFYKNAKKVGLPDAIHRWLRGVDSSEKFSYPIATVDRSVETVHGWLKRLETKDD